jgi:SPP1 family predicted phage head-tail adaptor
MILNGRPFNPGEMRTKITLKSRSVSAETGGFQIPILTTVAEVWAKWENVHGSEVWTAQSVQAVQPATVTIRYRAGMDTTWSILKGTDLYEIVSMDDIQERHEYLEIKAQRVRAG